MTFDENVLETFICGYSSIEESQNTKQILEKLGNEMASILAKRGTTVHKPEEQTAPLHTIIQEMQTTLEKQHTQDKMQKLSQTVDKHRDGRYCLL